MNRKKIAYILVLLTLFGLFLITIIVLIPKNPKIPTEPIEIIEPEPYVKEWSELEYMTIYFNNGHIILNYTIPSSMTYSNLILANQFNYPIVYMVSSDMFENFSEAIKDIYFDHYESPILDKVYQFEFYNQYNIYGSFSPPYLGVWFVFICNNHAGTNYFQYSDTIS